MTIDNRMREVLERGFHHVLPLEHPTLTLYARNAEGRPALVADLPFESDRVLVATEGVRVSSEVSEAGGSYLSFESSARGWTPMFDSFVDGLLRASSAATSPEDAVGAMLDAYDGFRRMFAARRGRLSKAALRGLAAELILLADVIDAGVAPRSAVSMWRGPFGAAKDFVFGGDLSVEVKSSRRQQHLVQISNLEQLDPRGEILQLAVIELDEVASSEGVTVAALHASVWKRIHEDALAVDYYSSALSALGFDPDDDWYDEVAFRIGEWRCYSVGDDFPRVRGEQVPSGVINVKFTIDLDEVRHLAVSPAWGVDHE